MQVEEVVVPVDRLLLLDRVLEELVASTVVEELVETMQALLALAVQVALGLRACALFHTYHKGQSKCVGY